MIDFDIKIKKKLLEKDDISGIIESEINESMLRAVEDNLRKLILLKLEKASIKEAVFLLHISLDSLEGGKVLLEDVECENMDLKEKILAAIK